MAMFGAGYLVGKGSKKKPDNITNNNTFTSNGAASQMPTDKFTGRPSLVSKDRNKQLF